MSTSKCNFTNNIPCCDNNFNCCNNSCCIPTSNIGFQGSRGVTDPPGAALISAYGGKYNNIGRTLDTLGAGTWMQVPLVETMDNINIVETTPNTIELEQDGVYKLNYLLNFSVKKAATVTIMVRKNSVMIPETVLIKQIKEK